jgi:hypothetical protein
MWIGPEETAEAVEPVVRDLQATLGWTEARAWSVVLHWLLVMSVNAPWYDPSSGPPTPEEVDESARILLSQAIDRMQQWLHDTFVDATWPSCPRHPNHPMWIGEADDGSLAWFCSQDEAVMVPVGTLAAG